MQELNVTSWQLFGHDRLYVNLPDGTAIGWADRANGTITVLHPSYRDAVTDALARQVPDLPALCEAAPPGPPLPRVPPQIPPLRRMRQRGRGRSPAASRERDPAQEPAGVPASAPVGATEQEPAGVPAPAPVGATEQEPAGVPAPAPAGVTAQEPAEVSASVETQTEARAHAPAPADMPERTAARRVLPALTSGNDLAPRRPGTALRAEMAGSGPGERVRAATGALRRRKEADPLRTALTGERRVGAELKRLTRHGWRVLHSVPLPDSADIGHLLIGPGGVFTVTTAHHPGASVRLGDGTLRLGDGTPQPYEGGHRTEARRTQRMLEAHCVFAVPVQPVLVFVGVASLDVTDTPPGVRVYRERQVAALAPLTGVLTATQVERVYDIARNREAWLDA